MYNKKNIRQGLLKAYNLWDFWDELGESLQIKIIDSFKSKPLMWDYNDLFNGNKRGSATHGSIDLLTTIFIIDDLDFCDLVFKKYKTYTSENYANNSEWGANWLNDISHIRRIAPLNDNYQNINTKDIYWVDVNFFLHVYTKAVYKNYLKGLCSIERFENAVHFEIENIDKIKLAITKIYGWTFPLRNNVIDQYLIYLEKQKRFDDCINLINQMRDKGWKNDLEKRLIRCEAKKNKNGSKS
jgi:hypothetical protein